MLKPPMNCDRAVFAFTIVPASYTLVARGTRTSPVSWSTRTSTKCAPNACMEWVSACGDGPSTPPSTVTPSGGT